MKTNKNLTILTFCKIICGRNIYNIYLHPPTSLELFLLPEQESCFMGTISQTFNEPSLYNEGD